MQLTATVRCFPPRDLEAILATKQLRENEPLPARHVPIIQGARPKKDLIRAKILVVKGSSPNWKASLLVE
jgi:hypothetical protein